MRTGFLCAIKYISKEYIRNVLNKKCGTAEKKKSKVNAVFLSLLHRHEK